MSNIFQEVLKDANSVQQKYLGPDYPYYKNIRPPRELGMSSDGDLGALGRDINGLTEYVKVLVTGQGNASRTGQPLGNKFFLKTGGKCKDVSSKQQVDRYIYIDNVPEGNIPIISQGLGINFSEFKGLIPGVISNLNAFNPYTILQGFMEGSIPDCQELQMQTIDVYNNRSTESHFVTLTDIQNMDPCTFSNKRNPLTGAQCKETYQNMVQQDDTKNLYHIPTIPNDTLSQLYFASLGICGIYLLYHLSLKMNK
jgi:hypothetical protein